MAITLPAELVPLAQKVGVIFPPISEDELQIHLSIWQDVAKATVVSDGLNSWWSENYYAPSPKDSGQSMDALNAFCHDHLYPHIERVKSGAVSMQMAAVNVASFLVLFKKAIIESLYALKKEPRVIINHWYWSKVVRAEDSPDRIAYYKQQIERYETAFFAAVGTAIEELADGSEKFTSVTTQLKNELPKLAAG